MNQLELRRIIKDELVRFVEEPHIMSLQYHASLAAYRIYKQLKPYLNLDDDEDFPQKGEPQE